MSLIAGLWTHVGPGLFLALALPLFLVGLTAVAAEGWDRRHERSARGN